MAAALLVAAVADSITFVLLPVGAEANPLAAAFPLLALAAKALLVAFLLLWHHRYAPRLRAIGAIAWSVGACSNLLVLLS